MATNKLNEAAWNLSRSLNESNRALLNLVTTTQERNFHFAQGVFDNGIEVLRSHTEAATNLLQEISAKPDKQAEVAQTVVDSTTDAYDRNLRLAQSIFNDGIEVLKNSAQDSRVLTKGLITQSQKQQKDFQAFAQEFTRSYLNFWQAPFTYYSQTFNKTESKV
jgi:hypothetical protein